MCTTVTDEDGRFSLNGLAAGSYVVEFQLSPWHAAQAPATDDAEHRSVEDVAFVAPGAAGADLDFLRPPGASMADFDIGVQFGSEPWRLAERATGPFVDARGCMVLRGVAEVPCRLVAAWRGASKFRQSPLAPGDILTIEFTPRAGDPPQIAVDRRSLLTTR